MRAARAHDLERRRTHIARARRPLRAERINVLCVTDHILRSDDPFLPNEPTWSCLDRARFRAYVAAVELEDRRARAVYGTLVLPGAELTDTRLENAESAHAVAVGLGVFVSVDDGIEAALREACAHGAAVFAAHP